MERSSEHGVRCQCGKLNEPTESLWVVCSSCGEAFPYRVEQRTFYVTGEYDGPRHCTCDFCEGKVSD